MTKRMDNPDTGAEQAAVLIDPRLADVWSGLWELGDGCVPLDGVAGLLRLAYVTGYHDCLSETERGALFRRLGLRVPPRVKARRAGPPGSG